MIGAFFIRYGLIVAPIGLVVGIVQGDSKLILGAAIWGVISYLWLFARLAKKGQERQAAAAQGQAGEGTQPPDAKDMGQSPPPP
jgi:hypothetical protein